MNLQYNLSDQRVSKSGVKSWRSALALCLTRANYADLGRVEQRQRSAHVNLSVHTGLTKRREEEFRWRLPVRHRLPTFVPYYSLPHDTSSQPYRHSAVGTSPLSPSFLSFTIAFTIWSRWLNYVGVSSFSASTMIMMMMTTVMKTVAKLETSVLASFCSRSLLRSIERKKEINYETSSSRRNM